MVPGRRSRPRIPSLRLSVPACGRPSDPAAPWLNPLHLSCEVAFRSGIGIPESGVTGNYDGVHPVAAVLACDHCADDRRRARLVEQGIVRATLMGPNQVHEI